MLKTKNRLLVVVCCILLLTTSFTFNAGNKKEEKQPNETKLDENDKQDKNQEEEVQEETESVDTEVLLFEGDKTENKPDNNQQVTYKTEPVTYGTIKNTYETRGRLAFVDFDTISYKVEYGTLIFESWLVEPGQMIKKGDPVAKVHVEVDEIALEQKKLELSRVKEEYRNGVNDRNLALKDKKKALDEIKDKYQKQIDMIAYNNSKKELDAYKESMDQTIQDHQDEINGLSEANGLVEIISPFQGAVGQLAEFVSGQQITEWDMIARIINMSKVMLRVNNESGLLQYNMPMEVNANIGGTNVQLTGRVVSSNAEGLSEDLKSQVSYIRIDGDLSELLDGYMTNYREIQNFGFNVSVTLWSVDNVLLVNRNAVKEMANYAYANILENGKLKKQSFIIGKYNTSFYWSIAGLQDGMQAVVGQ